MSLQSKKIVAFGATILSLLPLSFVEASSKNETVCEQDTKSMRVSLRHIDPNGIGYNQGYTTVDGFFSLYDGWDRWRLFLDTRLHIFNSGRPALNAGLAARYVGNSRVWGGNAYYDYRKTHRYHYNQITLGFESLGETWDFRLNGYAPVGSWSSPYYDTGFGGFQGNYLIARQKYEYALGGLNAEAAIHVEPSKHFPLYFAAGPYYLHGRGGTTWGGQARASVRIYDYLKIEGNVSYDHLFKWIGQGQIGLTFSFGGAQEVRREQSECASAVTLSRRSYQPVDRFEIIPVDKAHKLSTAIDPATGAPFFFVFVDNQSSSLGTYESPYPTLAEAQVYSNPGDYIYVFPGDGTTALMDVGITLQDNQKFWGSAGTYLIQATQGAITIPALSTTAPQITNIQRNAIDLATNNYISGFIITTPAGSGIVGTDPLQLQISDCTIMTTTLSSGNAIYVATTTTTAEILISDCYVSWPNNGSTTPIFFNANPGSIVLSMEDTIMDNAAIFFEQSGTTPLIQCNLTNTTITNSSSTISVFWIVPTGSINQFNFFADNCDFTNNTSTALFLRSGGGGAFIGNALCEIENCSFTDNTGSACGYYCNTSSYRGIFNNNYMASNGDSAIQLQSAGGTISRVNLFIDNNQILNNATTGGGGAQGIELDGSYDQLTATITNNTITGNNGTGIFQGGGTNGTETILISNNTISNNLNGNDEASGGISIDSFTTLNLTVTNNTLSNNAIFSNIIGSQTTPTGSLFVDFADNKLENGDSFTVDFSGASPTTACLNLSGNKGDGSVTPVYIFDQLGTGSCFIAPCNYEASNTGTVSLVGTPPPTSVNSCTDRTACD